MTRRPPSGTHTHAHGPGCGCAHAHAHAHEQGSAALPQLSRCASAAALLRDRQALRWAGAIGLAVLGLAVLEASAEARPGGGQSYSGGGSSSSGGGGGGGEAELLFLLIRLCIHYPAVGFPLLGIAIAYFIYKSRKGKPEEWNSPAAAAAPRRSGDLSQILGVDPNFSPIVFQDFVYRLYASAQQARRIPAEMAALAPYLAEPVRKQLVERAPTNLPIGNVVVGAMRVVRVDVPSREELVSAQVVDPDAPPPDPQVTVRLAFEANMSTAESTYYAEEIWTLVRSASAKSRPPEKVEVLGCPNCGAPFTSTDNQRCDYCGEIVEGGRFDWQVRSIQVVRQDRRPPALTGNVEERGTDLPTIIDPHLKRRWQSLTIDDPALTVDSLRARVEMVYKELNAAWSALDAPRLRPYVSDGMFDYLRYWLDAYREQGLRNIMDDAGILRVLLVKVSRDRYYDAVTIRLYATGKDYTVDAKGKVVAGSKRRQRKYSEYWTLIRGAEVRGAARADANCPQCGAPLKVSMAGACEYCGAHITRGEFDWVLSKIEQDESYSG
jgi:predicted lipid-binding transport protein (Tim44 family)